MRFSWKVRDIWWVWTKHGPPLWTPLWNPFESFVCKPLRCKGVYRQMMSMIFESIKVGLHNTFTWSWWPYFLYISNIPLMSLNLNLVLYVTAWNEIFFSIKYSRSPRATSSLKSFFSVNALLDGKRVSRQNICFEV